MEDKNGTGATGCEGGLSVPILNPLVFREEVIEKARTQYLAPEALRPVLGPRVYHEVE